MKDRFILGIDTSNYTTSVALATTGGVLFRECRKLLTVKPGNRGLRQSEAFYQHVMNLPDLLEELLEGFGTDALAAVTVSTRPRNQDGSYMPCFIAGLQFARTIAQVQGIPVFETTHQDGHIMASMYDVQWDIGDKVISVHLSGGTSEILTSQWNGQGFDVSLLGGTLDISAGQLLDRVGVAMGLPFPCGKALDEMVPQASKQLKYPTTVKGSHFNLSGAESYGLKHIDQEQQADIAAGLFGAIEISLCKSIMSTAEETGLKKVVMAGGVSSSKTLSKRLTQTLKKENIEVVFCKPAFAADNAIGVALIGAALLSQE